MLDILLPKLHREGQKFLTISLILTFILLLFSKFLGFLGIIISIWVFYFFRDPDRYPILDNNFLVAPADGMICQIESCLLYTSPSPRDRISSRMPSSA